MDDGSLVGGIAKVAPYVNQAGKNIKIALDGTTRDAWETVLYCQKQIEKEGYSLQPNFSQNFSKTNDSSVENIWTQPSDGTTYKVSDYNPLVHYMRPTHPLMACKVGMVPALP